MGRLIFLIVFLTAIATYLVHIRQAESTARYEIHKLQSQQIKLRRRLWDQQVKLGQLTAPREVRLRAEEMSLDLTSMRSELGDLAGLAGRDD